MKKFGKRTLRFFLVLLLLAGVGTGGYFGYQWWQKQEMIRQRPKEKLAKDGTNTSPAWHNFSNYQKALREKYSFINKVSNYVPPRTWDGKDFVLPGLLATKSYDFKTKKVNTATAMTPQGITIAGKYILLTAYDGEHEHASVVYVLDKKTGKYLKTIQVAGRPHLGGIAYDPVAKNIWVTGSQDDSSALMSFSLKKLEKYSYNKKKQPIEYDNVISLPTIERASCVTYYDNQLFVGFFNTDGQGQIASYPIARSGDFKGTITSDQIKAVTGQVSWALGSGSASMDRQIQGIAFYQNWIILSQSYGSKDSKLYFFPISALNNLDEGNAEKVVTMPPYLEQIYVQNGQLLMLFESGSKAYARDQIMIVDRILSANINALLGG